MREEIKPGREKKIEKKERIKELLRFYSGLLTKKEIEVLTLFTDPRKSGAQVARELNVSRQAVHDHVRRSSLRMESCEKKLKLLSIASKNSMLGRKIANRITTLAKKIQESPEILREINEIEKLFSKLHELEEKK